MKKTIKTVISVLATLIIVFSIIIIFLGLRAINNKTLFYVFDYSYSIVPTDSMVGDELDSIDPFDFIIIKNIRYDELEIGDVIVFQDEFNNEITLLVHRIVGIHQDGGYQTKGDNPNYNVDPRPVTEENYLGRYHQKITFLKPIANLAINSRGLLFGVISIVLTIILISEVTHIIKVFKDEKEKKLIEESHAKKEEILAQLKNEIYLELSQENDETKPKK